jgi:hypothetical protein
LYVACLQLARLLDGRHPGKSKQELTKEVLENTRRNPGGRRNSPMTVQVLYAVAHKGNVPKPQKRNVLHKHGLRTKKNPQRKRELVDERERKSTYSVTRRQPY